MQDQILTRLADSVFKLAQKQNEMIDTNKDLCSRIDFLASIVVNQSKRNTVQFSKREVGGTAIGLVVLALVVLAIVLSTSGCGDNPRAFFDIMDASVIDASDEFDTGDTADTNFDIDSDSAIDVDTNTDIDIDTDSDTDTEINKCPWECVEKIHPEAYTCYWFDASNPVDSVANFNFYCPEGYVCCQPWPPGPDDLEIPNVLTKECASRQLSCLVKFNPEIVFYDLACPRADERCTIL